MSEIECISTEDAAAPITPERARGRRARTGCSIADVARACGVSAMTVSNVVNNRGAEVSLQTRERVLQAVRSLNYRPGVNAVQRRRTLTHALGVIFPDAGNELTENLYFAAVLSGIVTRATAHEQVVSLFAPELWSDVFASLRKYTDGRCDGLIVVTSNREIDILGALIERGVPFVCLSGAHENPQAPSITVDNTYGVEQAVRHLLDLGHTRIGNLQGLQLADDAVERSAAFKSLTESLGCDADPRLVVNGSFTRSSGCAGALSLLDQDASSRPTAIVCANDRIAIGVLDAARQLGLRVPDDLSIVGFDDILTAEITEPGLTTVRQPLKQMGSAAVDILLERIDDLNGPVQKLVMRPELIVRGSTARKPSINRTKG
ncbi:MAG: LacI family DNA-binding transcriptional regulator [Capsulimonadaceae bacterium]|nr:LacI family DNA-binding transcriptional regulator [Capsulimonadaceae bacterium]